MKPVYLTIIGILLFSATQAARSTMTLRMQSVSTGHFDDLTVYFDENLQTIFVSPEDELKTYSNIEGVPAFYSFSEDGMKCFKNGYSNLATTEIVSLGHAVDLNGSYVISALAINDFDATNIVRLEDRQTGSFTDLRTGIYTVTLNEADNDSGRFFIHITQAALFTYQNSGCQNNEGSITITIDPSVPWDICQLYDTANNPLATITNVNPVANFTGLPQGTYYVAFLCGVYSSGKYFELGGNYITSTINHSGQPVYMGQPTVFHGVATNATSYEWDFGDGTLITGVANPSMTYYSPGNYTVNLVCSNSYGCSSTTQFSITVQMPSGIKQTVADDLNISTEGKLIRLERTNGLLDVTSVQIYNLIGKRIYSTSWSSGMYAIDLNAEPSGYYFVSVKNANQTLTRRVYIER